MSEAHLLDTLVAHDDSPADWDDVLRRARGRRPPRLVLAAVAATAAALVVGPALGVLLTRHTTPQLPAGADRRNVVVIMQPLTGRTLVQAAPWKGHPHGICYVLLQRHAGCSDHGAGLFTPPVAGYTFDERVVSGTARTFGGRSVPLRVERFPKLHAVFFLRTTRVPQFFTAVVLRDANGKVVARYRLKH